MTASALTAAALVLASPVRLELLPPAEGFAEGREDVLSIASVDSSGTLTTMPGAPAITGVAAGAAQRIADGVWHVRVTPSAAGEVAIRASLGGASGEKSVKVEPAAMLTLSVKETELPPGARGTVVAVVDVRTASGEPIDSLVPRISTSAGSHAAPKKIGPGKWSTALKMPPERYPQAVLVSATVARRDVKPAVAVIALRGRATIPITSKPNAKITLRVGKRSFGPFTTNAQGAVDVAIEAGPADTTMEVESVDVAGNRGTKALPLDMPRWNRLIATAFAEPQGLDGRTRVTVHAAALDRRGGLADEAPRASVGGAAIELTGRNGVFTGSSVLALAAGTQAVTVSAGDSRQKVDVDVAAPPALALAIDLEPDAPLKMDGAPATIRAWRLDAKGRRIPGGAVPSISTSEGLRLTPLPAGTETASARVKALEGRIAPNTWVGAKAAGPGFTLAARRTVSIGAGEPVTVEVLSVEPPRIPADGTSQAEIRARVSDKWGNPVSGVKIAANATAGDVTASSEPEAGVYRIVVRAPRTPGSGSIGVVAGAARADAAVAFVRPPPRLSLAAGAGGISNLGALSSGVAWVEARRSIGAGESPWAGLVRLHGGRGAFEVTSAVGTFDVTVGQALALAGIRRRFTQPFSGWTVAAAVAAGGGMVQVDEKNAIGTVSESGAAFGGRVALSAERALMQRGGLVLEAGYGYVVADDALIEGNLGGAELTVGYRHGF